MRFVGGDSRWRPFRLLSGDTPKDQIGHLFGATVSVSVQPHKRIELLVAMKIFSEIFNTICKHNMKVIFKAWIGIREPRESVKNTDKNPDL